MVEKLKGLTETTNDSLQAYSLLKKQEVFLKKTDLIINSKEYKDVYVAESFFERFKGLMFTPKQKSFSLLIKNCNSIHTCFMKFNIDVFCLDKNFNVVKIYKNIKPFRFVLPVKNTYNILEIPVK